MRVEFSRHAKRRARLYRIPESSVTGILNTIDLPPGEHVVVRDLQGIRYPLKIVVRVEEDLITVVTNYPLKKAKR